MYEFGTGSRVRIYGGLTHGNTGTVTRYEGAGTKVFVRFDSIGKECWVYPHRLIPAEGTENIEPGAVRSWRNRLVAGRN